jgi:hypothetical protein
MDAFIYHEFKGILLQISDPTYILAVVAVLLELNVTAVSATPFVLD